VLSGGLQSDRIFGGSGNDFIDGGSGKNSIDAGSGNDLIDAANNHGGERINCGRGHDRVIADKSDRLRNCERVSRA
jgi:Ca2+-binding RTX toxin-like protein